MDAELGQLDALADRLRAVDRVGVEIAETALPEVLDEARRTAAAGTTPDGAAWPTKKDGGRALPNAAGAITATVSGLSTAVLVLVLRGGSIFHHLAKGKGYRRQVLFDPANGVPERMRSAIERAAARVVGRVMGGR